ncbi:lipopolysaccharide biosynthesis protein [Streptococcus thermophilus]|uniref:lipopolysaccharide biosynthesis protein n=1 Tax=Streptococcus thermophilus TaxID=1308 RepID=UPI0003EEE53C|nr:oligosaccharide flippase family protein [Streptococcus thermophilus]EWM59066.1 hypothetical protein Y018_04430 [Streptococcus thermophilus TH982]
MNSKVKQLISNTVIFAIGNILGKVFQYLLLILITYKLTTAEYGTADLITQTYSILFPVVGLGISEAILRFSLNRDYDTVKIMNTALFTNLIGVALFLLISVLGSFFVKVSSQYWYIIFLTAIHVFYWTFREYTRGLEMYKSYSFGAVLGTVIQVICCYIFVFVLDFGLDGYIYSITISILLELVFYVVVTKSFLTINFDKVNKVYLKDLLAYSIPLIPNSIMWWLTSSSDRYILAYLEGESANGIYAVASKFPAMLTLLSTFFIQSWQTSSIKAIDDKDSTYFFNLVFEYLIIFLITVSTLLMFSKPILLLMLPENYSEAYYYVPMLIIAAIFNILQSFLSSILMADNKTKSIFVTTFIVTIFNISLSFILIDIFGIYGACISTLVSYILLTCLRVVLLRSSIHFKTYGKYIFPMMLLFLQMLLMISDNHFILMVFIAIIIITFLVYCATRLRRKRNEVSFK